MTTQPAPEGVKVISWDSWEHYPTWKTEKQLREMGLQAWGSPVGAVWYTNKYLYKRGEGHWLLLYDQTLARPKEISQKKQAATAKAKQTARQNRTCAFCNKVQLRKITRTDHLCYHCARLADTCTTAQGWLDMPNAVIMDFETTGLVAGTDEIIQIGIVDMQGNILLDTYVKPLTPINETIPVRSYQDEDDYYRDQPTAFEVNGISNEMVKNAPTFDELYPRLHALLDGKYIIAYNVDFERSMLRGELARRNLPGQTLTGWDCAMTWFSYYYGEWNRKRRDYNLISLDQACYMNNIRLDVPSHSGAGDCLRTLALIKTIASKPYPNASEDNHELQHS